MNPEWLTARYSVVAPIAGGTNLEQLNDLIAAAKVELDHSSMELLNQASALCGSNNLEW